MQELFLQQAQLNWKVRTEELVTESGIIVPNKKAIIRDDNDTILSVMGSGYEVYQNDELMELLFQISNRSGLELHKGGYFGSGEKVYIQLKSDDLNLGNDRVEGYVTGINSFDGTTSLGFGNSFFTISCANTFFRTYRSLHKVTHTASLRDRVNQYLTMVQKALEEERQTFRKIEQIREVHTPADTQARLMKALFDLNDIDRFEDLSTRKQNQITRFKTAWDTEISDKGDNYWGAFSAVTRYTTHDMYVSASAKKRTYESQHFGMGKILNDKAWEIATKSL